MWLEGFQLALSGPNLAWLLAGSLLGLIVGVLPGLGPTFGVALMLPFTFSMEPGTALIFLCAIHAACNYGDSFSSLMLNVPGGPGTVATCWDGYPMAKKGFAGRALGIATLSSFFGGAVAWLSLALIAKPISDFALRLGAPEYFALGIMALGLISVGSQGETVKGLAMACLGLALSFIGDDPITGLGSRFFFGVLWLEAGIPIVVSTLGIFAISQVIVMLEEGGTIAEVVEMKDSVLAGFADVVRHPITLLRAGVVGWFLGIMPALGVSLAGITSYLVEKRYAKEPEKFGTGEPAGLIAAEVGKGACVVGDLIPTLTLGVPGSVTGAILMVALIVHGVEPGPRFLTSGSMPYVVFAGILLAQALFIPTGLFFGKWLSKIVYLPNALLAPAITVLCYLGAYAERSYTFDLLLVVLLGLLAYVLGKLSYPVVCLVLGLILGPLIEANFHRSLAIGMGSYSVFWTRPVTLVLIFVTAIFLLWPFVAGLVRRWMSRQKRKAEAAGEQVVRVKPVSVGEIILLVVLAVIMVAFLAASQGMRASSAMFPRIACTAGLVLVLSILAAEVVQIRRVGMSGLRIGASAHPLFSGSLDWRWSVGLMAAYTVGAYLVGFVVASGLYVAAMAFLTGYRRRWLALGTAVGIALAVKVFADLVSILLPAGVFGQ